MKSKLVLKPWKMPKRVKFERTLDFWEFKKRVEAFLPEKRADQLAFDLMEIDEACETFRRNIKLLFAALRTAKRDSLDMSDCCSFVLSDIIEFRNHFDTARPALSKLDSIARELPPLDKATDLQITERVIAASDVFLKPFKAEREAARKKAKKRLAKKKPTRRSGKKKTKKRAAKKKATQRPGKKTNKRKKR